MLGTLFGHPDVLFLVSDQKSITAPLTKQILLLPPWFAAIMISKVVRGDFGQPRDSIRPLIPNRKLKNFWAPRVVRLLTWKFRLILD